MCPIHTHTHGDQVMVFSPLGEREGGRAKVEGERGKELEGVGRNECEAALRKLAFPWFYQIIIRVITCTAASLRPSMSIAAIR
jgi:hypothetical protein